MKKEDYLLLSNDELISLFKKHEYSLNSIDKSYGFPKSTSERLFKQRGIDYNLIKSTHKNSIIDAYNKNPKLCKFCGKPIPWDQREKDFCNNSCSASYTNRGRNRYSNYRQNNIIPKEKKEFLEKLEKLYPGKYETNNINYVNSTTKISLLDKITGEVTYLSLKDLITIDKVNKKSISLRKRRRHSTNKKTKEERLEQKRAASHNRILNTNYGDLGIKPIKPGCCPICGEYHCEKEFCKKHNFLQLIGFTKYLGFDPKKIGTSEVFDEFNRVRNIVYDLYWNKGWSMLNLGKHFHYVNNRMHSSILHNLDIPIKSLSKAVSDSVKGNRLVYNNILHSNQFKCNLHTTWEGVEVFLRSSYELNYAKDLDNKKIKYSVESLKIDYYDTQTNKFRIAIPDFYLIDLNTVVEIKSDFTLDIQEMRDKFKAYKNLGYNTVLLLEQEEIDLDNIEIILSPKRLNKILNHNLRKIKENS